MSSLAVLALMASTVMGQAEETQNPLQEFADDFCGCWVAEWTADEDSPDGKMKEGDKGTTVVTIDWGLNESIVELDASIGPAGGENDVTVKGVVAWEPGKGQIVIYAFTAAGRVGKTVCAKEGGVWKWVSDSTDREGVKRSGEATIEITDNGNTHIHHQTKRREGDAELSDEDVTYKRRQER